MWFKQAKLYQLTDSLRYSPDDLSEKLEALAFRPCLPSLSQSIGWVSPVDEEGSSLTQAMNGHMMICLQIEEKILPAVVVRQELAKKIKEIEQSEDRKVKPKERSFLKEEITTALLPRAFSKLSKVYAYIDTKNNLLILGTANEKKAEQFIGFFKKSITGAVFSFEIKKLSSTLTHWLKYQSYPSSFYIEKSCMLQDPNQESRIIRCQQQDLFASSIQSLIKEGCEVKQLALNWQDRINFVLSDDLSLSSIQFQDEIKDPVKEMEVETPHQKFHADFFIMSKALSHLVRDLIAGLLGPIPKNKIATHLIDIDK